MPRILYVLLDLSLLPAGCRIAELGFEEIVAGHRLEADIDVAILAAANLVDRGLHVVVDAAARNTTEHAESMIVSVEQHLVRLQEICSNDESPGISQLRMRHLQLRPLVADDRPVLGPVELEGLARLKGQRHERSATRRLALPVPIGLPFASKGRDPAIGTIVAEAQQIGMKLLHRALLFAGLVGLGLQPGREPVGKRIKLTWSIRHLELWLDAI